MRDPNFLMSGQKHLFERGLKAARVMAGCKQEAQLSQRDRMALNILLSQSRSFKMTPLSRARV